MESHLKAFQKRKPKRSSPSQDLRTSIILSCDLDCRSLTRNASHEKGCARRRCSTPLRRAQYLIIAQGQVTTTEGPYDAGYVVNAAGLYADRIARDFGFAEHYRILPFKGLYLYSSEPAGSIRTNIYPVPDLKNPFLGVHFTVASNGKTKIGPTAIPGLWREQYSGMANFQFNEFLEVAMRGVGLLASSNFDFKALALREAAKVFKVEDGLAGERSRGGGQTGALSELGQARDTCAAS